MAQIEADAISSSTTASSDDAPDGQSWLSKLKTRLGFGESPSLRAVLEEALRDDTGGATAFSSQERDMLVRILRFGALRVDDVMVPRADIIAVDEQAPIAELLRTFEDAGHSRIPIYRDTLDDLRGMVHIKDVVSWLADQSGLPPLPKFEDDLQSADENNAATIGNSSRDKDDRHAERKNGSPIVLAGPMKLDLESIDLSQSVASAKLKRDILFVPPSMPAVNLLLRMQSTRVHLAMVVDEYGGTDGLVSIEDLVEEIVGTIEDEHDDQTELIREDPRLGLVAAARTPVGELEELLGLQLLDDEELEDIDTLGGLVFSLVKRVPVRGELVRHPCGLEFEVLDADPRRIKALRVHRRNVASRDGSRTPSDGEQLGGPGEGAGAQDEATSGDSRGGCERAARRGAQREWQRRRVTPVAGRVTALGSWPGRGLLFAAGALSVLGLPPFGLWPVLFLTIPLLVWRLDAAHAATRQAGVYARLRAGFGPGWWFGFGYFGVGLHWIGSAFLVEAEIFAWMMPFAMMLLPAGIAIFFGLATAAAALVWHGRAARLVVLALAFLVQELVRGTVFTGFPWNGFGTLLAVDPGFMQATSLMGVHALAGVAVLMFAAPALLRAGSDEWDAAQQFAGTWGYLGAVGTLVVGLAAFGAWRLATLAPTLGVMEDTRLRLVQPAIPQAEKWVDGLRLRNFERLAALSLGKASPDVPDAVFRSADIVAGTWRDTTSLPSRAVSHVIWPESALPFWVLDEPQALLAFDHMLGDDRVLIVGALRYDPAVVAADGTVTPRQVYNSLMVFDQDARLGAVYDKRHLVPFGEYLPFQATLEAIGLEQITRIRGGFAIGDGPRRVTAPGLAMFSPLICYEVIFPGAAVDADGVRPRWLLNLTNDAWFGDSIGPHQHLHHARLRAVEEGLGLVRLANNGITAVIDPLGRMRVTLGLNVAGVIDTAVPAPLPPTVFARLRPWPSLLLAVVLAGIAFGLRQRREGEV